MPVEAGGTVEYETKVVGAAYLVKQLLDRLGVAQAIDAAVAAQPVIGATYGTLAQVIIVHRMAFDPQPVSHLAPWAQRPGLDRLCGLEAGWLDDDRSGALLEAVASQPVVSWTAGLTAAVRPDRVALDWLREATTSISFAGADEDEAGRPKGGKGGEAPRLPRLVPGSNKDGKPKKVHLVLSLLTGGTSGRVPVWYRPWDGKGTDEPVSVADMATRRATLLAPANAVLLGDRTRCTEATRRTCCRQHQQFVAAHPWTDLDGGTAKAVWQETWAALEAARLAWQPVDSVSRHHARTPPDARPEHRVVEVGEVAHHLVDPDTGERSPRRWRFTWSSRTATQDAARRTKALAAGAAALARLARVLGKDDDTRRSTIEARIEQARRRARAHPSLAVTLEGTDADQAWPLTWAVDQDAVAAAARFDGVVLRCRHVPPTRCTAAELVVKHKGQIGVEQTSDCLKSPVQLRPMWLLRRHAPKRLAGLTLLIMLAVLVAARLEHQVRRQIARTGEVLRGLMPEGRDTPYPTAKARLRAFREYALVLLRHPDGAEEVHHPKLRPIQQQIWSSMELAPLPT